MTESSKTFILFQWHPKNAVAAFQISCKLLTLKDSRNLQTINALPLSITKGHYLPNYIHRSGLTRSLTHMKVVSTCLISDTGFLSPQILFPPPRSWSHRSIRYMVFAIGYTICSPQTRFSRFRARSLECRL